MLEHLLQKNGIIVSKIARTLYNMSVGERLPSIDKIAKKNMVGRGTVQTAIQVLVDEGCIKINSNGSRGTVLTDVDKTKLWHYTGWGNLLGVFPLPNCIEVRSLVAAMSDSFEQNGIDSMFGFMFTARQRFEALNDNKCAFIVVSELSYRVSKQYYENIEFVGRLTGCSCTAPYVLLGHDTPPAKAEKGATVAIKSSSREQSFIADIICREYNLDRVDIPQYHAACNAFKNNVVDYMLDRSVQYNDNMRGYPMYSLSEFGLNEAITTPVVVANKNNEGMIELLNKCISADTISEAQTEMLVGNRDPFNFF